MLSRKQLQQLRDHGVAYPWTAAQALRLVDQLERTELHFVTQKDRAEDLQDELDRVREGCKPVTHS